MVQKKEGGHELDVLIQQRYVPTEAERKRAVMMYFFVWIMIVLDKKSISMYEVYHVKQAVGWWLLFFFILVTTMFLFFVPYKLINLIPMVLLALMLVVWWVFVKQAWEWKYLTGKHNDRIFLPFFFGLWSWVLNLFDFYEDMDVRSDDYCEDEQESVDSGSEWTK